MPATFEVTRGTFKCKNKRGSKRINEACVAGFWSEVGTGDRQGIYIFGVKASRGWKPLYVGQTKKQTFRKRVQQHIDQGRFNRMLKGIKKGAPVLFLLGRVGKGRRSTDAINELETTFINSAFSRNKNLHNDRGIRRPKYIIHGFNGRGRCPAEVAELKKMMGY